MPSAAGDGFALSLLVGILYLATGLMLIMNPAAGSLALMLRGAPKAL